MFKTVTYFASGGNFRFMKKERLKELDILRAIAFIFVVAQHTLGGSANAKNISFFDYSILKFLYVIAETAVPIFLFVSGLSLLYVYADRFDWKKYYIKRLKYVLIPYVVWSAINMFELKTTERFQNFIVQLIAGNGAYHLWYMGMVLRLFLVFPIILFIAKKIHSANIKIRVIIFIALTVLYYYVSKYTNVIQDDIASFLFKNPTELQHKIVNISVLFWYVYFVLGMYFALNYKYIKDKVLKNKTIIFIAYVPLLIYAYLHEIKYNNLQFIRVLWILYIIVSILLFYTIATMLIDKIKVYSFMRYISDYSFSAYMAHVIFITYVVKYINIIFGVKDILILGILTWIGTFMITTFFISVIALVPYSQFVTGAKNVKMRLGIKDLYKRFIK